jgi:two-component system chemotaxis response regulator CheY
MACDDFVMIVDDDAEIRAALRDHLEVLGCSIVDAVDGVHALETLKDSPRPCLVLLDLNMPRLDGEGFVRAVRADSCHCRLAIASMTAGQRRQPESTQAHLRKPFGLDDLNEVLRRFCRSPDLIRP